MADRSAIHKNILTTAYVVKEKGAPFELQDVVLDEVHHDEVLVEIKYTGLCHTDIVVQQGGMPIGSYPAVLGHEGVGIVRYVGSDLDGDSLKPGDPVILSFRTCQSCAACQEDRLGACPHMTEFNFLRSRRHKTARSPISLPDGTPVHGQFFGQSSLSKMAIVARQSVVKCAVTSDELPFLAPLACGYLTGAGTVINALKPKQTTKIAILGMGAVGMAALMAAKSLGAEEIIAVDIVDAKLELARELGATKAINTKEFPDLAARVRQLFPNGVDQVLDATGVSSLLQASLKFLAHDGVLALVGVPRPGSKIEVDALELLLSCQRIIGVVEGFSNPNQGDFPIDRLSTIYPAHALNEAIRDLKAGTVIKPIISWE